MVVVGAGPAGSRVARNLARRGVDVILVEEHKTVGEPCHCSGLVTPRTLAVAETADDLVLNSIRGATFHSKQGAVLRLTSPAEAALVIDRSRFDQVLAAQAVKEAAELRAGCKFVEFKIEGAAHNRSGSVRVTLDERGNRVTVSAKLLVGADGAASRVARQLRSGKRPDHLVRAMGGEAEYAGNHLQDHVQVFLDDRAAPGWFGWTIPLETGRARLGTGTTNGVKPHQSMTMLRESFPEYFAGTRLLFRRAGFIPVWRPVPMVEDRVMLVGDAARQVKPASGGGILTALLSADLAADEAARALGDADLSSSRLAQYSRRWDRSVGRELRRQHDMRRALTRLDESKIEALLTTLAGPKGRGALEALGDIDFPSRLVWRLLAQHPSLLFGAAVFPKFPLAWLRPRTTKAWSSGMDG